MVIRPLSFLHLHLVCGSGSGPCMYVVSDPVAAVWLAVASLGLNYLTGAKLLWEYEAKLAWQLHGDEECVDLAGLCSQGFPAERDGLLVAGPHWILDEADGERICCCFCSGAIILAAQVEIVSFDF